ncbi:MAG: hypothetical protein FWC59_02765 [Actinomycetia bacterium]|nr:hypothetical protein [Actinomycetes bacterium]
MTVITYKCPNCGGRVEFESSIQKLKCPYCDSTFDVQALQSLDQVLNSPAPPANQPADWQMGNQQWSPEEQANMNVYACQTCGGEIITDATLAATSCPYCGNPVVFSEKFSGKLKPDRIIPFQLDKAAAKAALLAHYAGKPLLPKNFKDDNFIDEIKGVYVPYWLFDATCAADGLYECSNSALIPGPEADTLITTFYSVARSGTLNFRDVPVDAAAKLADDLTESLEPFDFQALAPFQTAYLAGYFANMYDVESTTAIQRAEQRMQSTATQELNDSVQGYQTVSTKRLSIQYQNPLCSYALLPIWLLSTTYNKQVYTFAMNGQTGRLVGNLPVDKGRFWRYFFGIGCGVMLVVALIALLIIWFTA